jgi:hypothetical protein
MNSINKYKRGFNVDNEPIMVNVNGTYFCMIDTDEDNGVLVDDKGLITLVPLPNITVCDPRVYMKAQHMRKTSTPKIP